ncbi:hypothetical protein FRC00_010643 [Tulasnella sp. 408]|nr:hypothetical protein FRC00_010643 [Tulasnella sp. 408]
MSSQPAAASSGSVQASSGSVAGSATGSVVSGSGTGSSTLSIPQTAAAGGIFMTQPPQTANPSFYKIAPSNIITFAWNYTSLYVTPTSITVTAFCAANGYNYPVGGANGDGVYPGTVTSITWDPYAYQNSPGAQALAQETYTLRIQDERGANAVGTPGMMNAYSALKFALYKPGQATPLDQWSCPDCNSATNLALHPGFISIVVTFTVMILSGYGLLRRGLASAH